MYTKLTVNKAAAFTIPPIKNLAALLLVFLLSPDLQAQKGKNSDPNLPAFGVVEKADLQMKECDFDEKAEAMVLVDEGLLESIFGNGIELRRRIRIKILNDKGLDWANVHLTYLSAAGEENISGLEAQTYNLDASGSIVVTKVDKKLFYEKKLHKRYSEKVFTFPDVKVGSIIEYKYNHSNKGLIDWYFQRSIPVRYSHFTIDFPSEIDFTTTPYCAGKYETKNDNTSTRSVTKYAMGKIPAFRDEQYIINKNYYHDRLETKITAYPVNGRKESRLVSWEQVIKFLAEDEDFGIQLKKNIPRTADLEEKLKGVALPYEKMRIIYKYVQKNMDWNEYNGIWAFDGVKSAWKDKKGTVGEINLILVNLLRDAGINAHPVLVSTHDNGIVNTLDAGTYRYPGFYQFDKVMAYIEFENKIYVLDATQKNMPMHLIPYEILMTQGLVIDKLETFEWGWKSLWKDDYQSKNIMMINCAIDENGKMKGEISINSYDYAKLLRQGTAKKGKDKFIETYVTEANPALMVEDVSFENLESDSLPLIQKIKFSQPLNAAGEYQYFSSNILTGLEKNPFVADNRLSDVFFGYNQSFSIYGVFNLPEGYEFDVLPKNIKLIMPDTSIVISRMAQVINNMLQTRIQLEFKKPYYPAAQYAELQDFYKGLFEILNEQFVVRKKKKV